MYTFMSLQTYNVQAVFPMCTAHVGANKQNSTIKIINGLNLGICFVVVRSIQLKLDLSRSCLFDRQNSYRNAVPCIGMYILGNVLTIQNASKTSYMQRLILLIACQPNAQTQQKGKYVISMFYYNFFWNTRLKAKYFYTLIYIYYFIHIFRINVKIFTF